ncbi:MAG: hypothetical protein NZ521_09960 [Flammeovirgaceae bacterium]|nr:hypothetical protein [Flammeovirgaceae bacterium]MDW8288557.1 hypothetical protein [Flammeovirgaceae bacterium]
MNESFQGIDFDYVYEVCGQNKPFAHNLLRVIYKGLSEYPKKILTYWENKDEFQLKEMAHKFKSSIAYLYFDEFDNTLDAIENNSEPLAALEPLIKKVIDLSDYAKKAIEEELAKEEH